MVLFKKQKKNIPMPEVVHNLAEEVEKMARTGFYGTAPRIRKQLLIDDLVIGGGCNPCSARAAVEDYVTDLNEVWR